MAPLTLMTADAVGGVWTYAVELARALADQGWATALAVIGPAPSEGQRAEIARLPQVTLHEHPGRLEWMDDPWADVEATGDWLLALERTLRPAVVHLNGYCHGRLPFSAPTLVVGHSCVRSWWREVRGQDAPSWVDRYTAEVRRGIRAAGLVVAPSGAMLASLQHDYGPLERTNVIPNGRSAGRSAASREPIVFTAGRLWDDAKNVRAVCDVAPGLAWPVYLAGDTGGVPLRATDGVRPLGRVAPADMDEWMARASIYALPARYEPFGLSALEAAHAGCALVLGAIDSLREIWGQAALFVPPDDRHALRVALERLIADPGLRAEMSARARTRAATFTPKKMAAEYVDAYRWLIERRTVPASRLEDGPVPGVHVPAAAVPHARIRPAPTLAHPGTPLP